MGVCVFVGCHGVYGWYVHSLDHDTDFDEGGG
jgi:hypothetical protein